MRFPWRRKNDKQAEERRRAEQKLAEVTAQWGEVRAQSAEAVEGLKRNHIAEGLNAIFGSHK